MKRLLIAATGVFGLSVALLAHGSMRTADVTGQWTGDVGMTADDGQHQVSKTLLDIKQEEDKVTGKIGNPDQPDSMIPFTGTVDGKTIKITAANAPDGIKLNIEFTVDGDNMKVAGQVAMGDMKMNLAGDLKKK